MWRQRLWFISAKQARRPTSPAPSSPSARSDDFGRHDHWNHHHHDRIHTRRSKLPGKGDLAREGNCGVLCNHIENAMNARCRFQEFQGVPTSYADDISDLLC